MDKPQEDKKKKDKFHKNSEKAFITCPACLQKVYGISEAQAKAMCNEHKRSAICKKIALALKQDRATRKDSKPDTLKAEP